MRVAICTDMEGLSGVDRVGHCFPAFGADYRHGVRMLVGDTRAAVEAALGAGASDVVLTDWHYLGRNLPEAAFPDLPIRRLWRRGRPIIGPGGLGRPDAAVLLGVHAGAGNPEGFLSHTFWMGMSLLLDGIPLSEAVLWSLALGTSGIPVTVVAGDQRATEETSHLLPGVQTVAVKAGTSRTSAILRPPQDAREELAEVVARSLASPTDPLTRPFPADATIRYGEPEHARRAERAGVGDRTGPRDVTARLGSAHDLMPYLARGMMATPLGLGPSAGDLLTPRGRGPLARLWAACVVGAGGWIERRLVWEFARERPDLYPTVGPSVPEA
jgi:D-amino peptidase